jgi:5-methyltetrahydrofolate--homocysteine methyltransferase
MAISAGMTSAITSPLHAETMQAVLGADVMMGNDPDCRQWIAKYREPRGRRGGRRRRRPTNG